MSEDTLEEGLRIMNEQVVKVSVALEQGDGALAQGILRDIFNYLSRIIPKEKDPEKRRKLEGINEFICDSRDRLIIPMERGGELPDILSRANFYQRLEVISDMLRTYKDNWSPGK